MSETTAIQWCDHSWSPWWGCTPVSPGCANCYAARWAKFTRGLEYRKGALRQRTKNWDLPLKWNKAAAGLVQSRTVFPSMCDPFDIEAPWTWFLSLMDLVIHTPHLTWLLLTKRPENAEPFGQRWAEERRLNWTGFPPNVWLGTSVENQEQADLRIPHLLKTPAKLRFLSVEPMLEPIDLRLTYAVGVTQKANTVRGHDISWVIVGGESGAKARQCGIGWIRSIVNQCKAAEVPVFVKQLGSNPVAQFETWPTKDRKGGDPAEWPEDLRVREFPTLP